MDSLKELIDSKKSDLKKKLNKKGWIPHSNLEHYEKLEYINKQKERDLKKVLKSNVKSSVNRKDLNTNTNLEHDRSDKNDQFNNEDVMEQNISKLEVTRRLRAFGEPIILFGENEEQIYNRLRSLEIQGRTNEEMNIGQQNIFTRGFDSKIALYSVNENESNIEINGEIRREEGESKENFIIRWIEIQLLEWEKILKLRSKNDAETNKGKQDSAHYYQTKRDIQPLINSLKNLDGKVDDEILEKLYEIVVLCCDRDYIKAQDKYIELAIGNAPWPMGVTMVGIHERAGRTKIFSSHIAHVLNDETTRKYIQMFKRLITHCELRRPSVNNNNNIKS